MGPFPFFDDGVANLMTSLSVKHNEKVLGRISVFVNCIVGGVFAVVKGLGELTILWII